MDVKSQSGILRSIVVFIPFYPEASADELQPVPDHFLKSLCQHYKMTGLHLKWT